MKEEEDEKEEDEEEESMVQIDTASKKKAKGTRKGISRTPLVGQKRKRAASKRLSSNSD